MNQPALSFIIPAYNEEKSLPRTLKSIRDHVPSELSHEVIVADNGSEDATVHVARERGAEVIVDETATVARLRNRAAGLARGRVLVFLDADILLTAAWHKNIPAVYRSLADNPWQITGSRCGVSENASWVEEYWFKPLIARTAKYINSGHLLTSSALFRKVGGFDEKLETGEDYAFSQSASAVNAVIVNNPALAVIHEGYPRTLREFVRREVWHGRGDCKSARTIMASNVALASILMMVLQVAAISALLWPSARVAGLTGAALIAAGCMLSAVFKHRVRTVTSLAAVSYLYYFYYLSRFLSCIQVSTSRLHSRRHRASA